MKRFVGGGDDWHVRMDVIYGHSTNHHIDNLLGSKIKRSRILWGDTEHNNQIDIDNLDGKQVLDNTRRGDDGQQEASGATDNMTRQAGGG